MNFFRYLFRVSLPVARIAVGVPGSTVFMSFFLFVPLPFVPTAVIADITRIGFWRTTIVTRRAAVVVLPTWGSRASALMEITTDWWGARTFTAVGGRAVVTVSMVIAVFTTVIPRTLKNTIRKEPKGTQNEHTSVASAITRTFWPRSSFPSSLLTARSLSSRDWYSKILNPMSAAYTLNTAT